MTFTLLVLLALSLSGVAFAGYLSGVKFFSQTCAFNEHCPYFLGYPACYFGLLMYLALATLAILMANGYLGMRSGVQWMLYVAIAGTLFSGYFTFSELPTIFSRGFNTFLLGLPTCAWGLLIYIAIVLVALYTLRTLPA